MQARSALAILLLACSANAAFYDVDLSIDIEKGLPPVEAILAGKFERQSDAYYDRVIEFQRQRESARHIPRQAVVIPAALDYAPALARRGQLKEALAAIDPSRNGASNSPLETSTRGSIYLALGDYESAIRELEASIRENESEPFTHERYQLMLARHLQRVAHDPTLIMQEPTFVSTMLRDVATTQPSGAADARVEEALTALLALIRSEDVCQAHVYAAIGEILEFKRQPALAYRAYRRAVETSAPQTEHLQNQIARLKDELKAQPDLDAQVDAERRAADEWVKAYQAIEDLTSSPFVPNESRAKFYRQHGNLRDPPVTLGTSMAMWANRYWPALSLSAALVVVLLIQLIRKFRAPRAISAAG